MYKKILLVAGVYIEFDKIENIKSTKYSVAQVFKREQEVAYFANDRYELKYCNTYFSDMLGAKKVFFEIKEK